MTENNNINLNQEMCSYGGTGECNCGETEEFNCGGIVEFPIIPIKTDILFECTYNSFDFEKGLKDISYLAGQITALVNTGVPPQIALDYIATKDSYAIQLKALEIQKEIAIETAKLGAIELEKQRQV